MKFGRKFCTESCRWSKRELCARRPRNIHTSRFKLFPLSVFLDWCGWILVRGISKFGV